MTRGTGRVLLAVGLLAACVPDTWTLQLRDAAAPDARATADGRSDGSDDVSGDGGSVYACGADVGLCNPVGPGTCPSGQACTLVPNGHGGEAVACSLAGGAGWGAPCPTATECSPGYTCAMVEGSTGPTCVRACCTGDPTSCSDPAVGGREGNRCTGIFPDDFLRGIGFCVDPYGCGVGLGTCNPLLGTSCPQGQRCALHSSGSSVAFACIPIGGGGWGDPCTAQADCGAGLLCSAGSSGSHCEKLCCPGDDARCADPAMGGHAGAACRGNFADPALRGLGRCA